MDPTIIAALIGALPGLANMFSGVMGRSGKPYEDQANTLQQWGDKAGQQQNPYIGAGQNAIPQYQNWLNSQANPSGFINDLMGKYKQSPYTTFLQKQSENAGMNAASAGGLAGSTPFMQQQQQNASNIAQGGLDKWMQSVLGVNTQYGQGLQNQITGGQSAANQLTNLYGDMGGALGDSTYGASSGQNLDFNNILSGLTSAIRGGYNGYTGKNNDLQSLLNGLSQILGNKGGL